MTRPEEELIKKLQEVEVPEPSPLFWEHFSQRVHDAVAVEPIPSASWVSRFNLAWAGGVAAIAVVAVLAVSLSVRKPEKTATAQAGVAPVAAAMVATSDSVQLDDASWTVIGELASEMDFDQANAAGFTVAPGGADLAVNQLSADEQRAAVELLQQAIKNSRTL